MPTYLLHGFRWSRPSIRIHIATHSLDDCAAEWLVLPSSALALLNSLHSIFDFLPPSPQPRHAPLAFNAWSAVKLLEQHDAAAPEVSQPYAYLGDYLLPVRLGADVGAVIAEYEARRQAEALPPPPPERAGDAPERELRSRGSLGELRRRERQAGWIGKLRDALEPGGEVGWFVVVCDDEVRGDGVEVEVEGEGEGERERERGKGGEEGGKKGRGSWWRK